MTNFLEQLPLQPRRSAGQSLLTLLFIAFLGVFLAQFIALLTALPFFGFDIARIYDVMTDPTGDPAAHNILLFIQGVSSLLAYGVFPYFFLRSVEHQPFSAVSPKWGLSPIPVMLTIGILYTFLVVDARVIEWNANLNFPPELETSLRQMEDTAMVATKVITDMNGIGDFLIVLLVIAVIPALVEEFLFRGLIQNYLHRLSGNPHVAIWIAALIFSAVHLQFYGFIPRVLLGALFGYLFYYSGNLSVPILAHFLNNGFSLVLVYVMGDEVIEGTDGGPEKLPWSFTIVALVGLIILFYYFRGYHRKQNMSHGELG